MTGKQRFMAAMYGKPVDRVPIWLREGFEALVQAPPGPEDFHEGWQSDPLYQELIDFVKPHVQPVVQWGIPGMNRLVMAPVGAIETRREQIDADTFHVHTLIRTRQKDLHGIRECRRGESTSWDIQPPVQNIEDLKALSEVPFEIEDWQISQALEQYRHARALAGDRGVCRLNLSSPIVCISGSMPFELFLELSLTDNQWFEDLCQMITERQLMVIDRLLDATGGLLDTIANLGGAEQCTPPMMSPQSFELYVVPYDGQLIRRLHEASILVNVHCHGKVRHALRCMIEMGADATDPIEPPAQGDITYAQVRQIAGTNLTLMGNLEWSELEHAQPRDIRQRVKEILSLGQHRLILAASAGPVSAVTRRLVDNYKAWIDAAIELGQ